MTNVTNRMIAACAGTIAFACAAVQGASAADMPQYGGPVVQERYGYQPPPAYGYEQAPPPVVYQEYMPPAVVPGPGPYYVPRRVYVVPRYRAYAYGYRPYIGGGYGWNHDYGYRRW